MLTIYCGNNTAESRKLFAQERRKCETSGIRPIDLPDMNVSILQQALNQATSASLFQDSSALFLENCIGNKAIRSVIQEHIQQTSLGIFIWEDGMADRDAKKYFPLASIRACMLPMTIWKFLDSIYPSNVAQVLRIHNELQGTVEGAFIMHMVIGRIKELILVLHALPGKSNRAPWQESKLKSQAKRWKEGHLMQFHKKLGEIAIGVKTGDIPYSTSQALDILFCFYLQ